MRYQKIISLCAWMLATVGLMFFAVSDIGVSHVQGFRTNFEHVDRIFSDLGPPTRVDRNANGEVVAVGEPLYMDVRLPVLTDSARVFLNQNDEETAKRVQIGVEDRDKNITLSRMLVIKGMTEIDLSEYKRKDGIVRFVISAPGTNKEHPLVLKNFSVVTNRKSLLDILWDEAHGFWNWLRKVWL